MKIGIVGGGQRSLRRGKIVDEERRELLFSYSRDMEKLRASAQALSPASKIGTPAEAVAFGGVIVLAVPWTAVPDALRQGGDLRGKIVMSTVNALKPDMSGLAVERQLPRRRKSQSLPHAQWLSAPFPRSPSYLLPVRRQSSDR